MRKEVDAQTIGHEEHFLETDGSAASLDLANEPRAHSCHGSHPFLGVAKFFAALSDCCAYRCLRLHLL